MFVDVDPKVARVWELVEPIAVEAGLEIVDIEHHREGRGVVLRLLMDKMDKAGGVSTGEASRRGVSLDELAAVSRQVSDVLDVHSDAIGATNSTTDNALGAIFTLEVSSPGVNRPLTRPEHFDAFVGKRVHLSTRAPVAGRKSFRGTLTAVESSAIVITIDDQSRHVIPFAAIARANYQHDFSPLPRAGGGRRGARARAR